jgi:hypothetical protein
VPALDRIFAAVADPTRRAVVARLTAARDDSTLMTLRQERLISIEVRDSHRHGWSGGFDELAALLAPPSAR